MLFFRSSQKDICASLGTVCGVVVIVVVVVVLVCVRMRIGNAVDQSTGVSFWSQDSSSRLKSLI